MGFLLPISMNLTMVLMGPESPITDMVFGIFATGLFASPPLYMFILSYFYPFSFVSYFTSFFPPGGEVVGGEDLGIRQPFEQSTESCLLCTFNLFAASSTDTGGGDGDGVARRLSD